MSFIDELIREEVEEQSKSIIDGMAKGLSIDAMAGLLGMAQAEFDKLVRDEADIRDALEIGEAKGILCVERLALSMARENGPILQTLLRNRLGWDAKDGASSGHLTVEVKKFINAEEKDDSDSE